MNMIVFDKKKYKIRQVQIDDLGEINIASTVLNKLLILNEGCYKSEEARFIDEQIYFFVEPQKLKLNDEKLINHIKRHCV